MSLSRSEYWTKTIGMAALLMFGGVLGIAAGEVMLLAVMFAGFILSIAQIVWAVQRFHDVGLSGAWILLNFLPVVGNLVVLIILCLPSDTFDTYNPNAVRRL